MHFDLRAPDGVAAEVKRLEQLGATVAHDQSELVVMRDPEGNEFAWRRECGIAECFCACDGLPGVAHMNKSR
jgi:hypothetical protein